MYSKKISAVIPKIMYKVLKHSDNVKKGYLNFRNRTIIKGTFDEDACVNLLERMGINKDNVLRYLNYKYIPSWAKVKEDEVSSGALFKDKEGQAMSCIQKLKVKDGVLLLFINKSEPHKLITDIMHTRRLCKDAGIEIGNEIKLIINQLQIVFQDLPLYLEILKIENLPAPASARQYSRQVLSKYKRLEDVAGIKRVSIKRKFLRYYLMANMICKEDFDKLLRLSDFSIINIRTICKEVRENSKELGLELIY